MNTILIIGGGIGGLTAAALLAKAGYPVTVLEASNKWGGCAGKFERKDFLFPVGATLCMGFERHNENIVPENSGSNRPLAIR